MAKTRVSESDAKKLALASRGQCEFDGCAALLFDPNTRVAVGAIAHIHAQSAGGPRFNPALSPEEIHDFSNLMFLCPLHHHQVDENDGDWPADALREMKHWHESLSSDPPIDDDAELEEFVRLALAALDTEAKTALGAWIAQQRRESVARCGARWMALGVEETLATELALDTSVGEPARELLAATESRGLVVLESEMGNGKTLVADRFFQRVLAVELDEATISRVPVFVRAREVGDASLGQALDQLQPASPDLPRTVVIDGLDEVTSNRATALLQDARTLTVADAANRVLITSRPLAILRDQPDVVQLPALSDTEAYQLVSRVAGAVIDGRDSYSWPPALADAIHRPLFALLMGLHVRNSLVPHVGSPWSLLREMVERVVSLEGLATRREMYESLVYLAVRVTEAGEAVDRRSLGHFARQANAESSRFVARVGSRIDFQLPALTRWFAAQSILEKKTEPEWLATSPERLDRWRDSIRIALLLADSETFSALMRAIAEADIGFAGAIIEKPADWVRTEQSPLRATQPIEMGHEFRNAVRELGTGLGPAAKYLGAYDESGEPHQLAFAASDGWVTYGWFEEQSAARDTVVTIPNMRDPTADRPANVRGLSLADEPGWAWSLALDGIAEELGDLLSRGELPPVDALRPELDWRIERSVTREGSDGELSIEQGISTIEQILERSPKLASAAFGYGPELTRQELQKLVDDWRHRLRVGETLFSSPWAPERLGLSSSADDPEYLAIATRRIFAAALTAYSQYVGTLFTAFAPRMGVASLLPVVMKGELLPRPRGPGASIFESDTLRWSWEPMPSEGDSVVEVRVVTEGQPWFSRENDLRVLELTARLRPGAPLNGLRFVDQVAHSPLFGSPASHLVYDWLWSDLEELGWVDGLGPTVFEYD